MMENWAKMAEQNGDTNNNSDTSMSDSSKCAGQSLVSLKGCKDWLEQQLLDYEAELKSMRKVEQEQLKSHGKFEPNVEGLYKSISQLEEELLQVSSTHSYKCYVLESLLLSYVKMRKLFSPDGENELSKDKFPHDCEEQLKLSRDISKYEQALYEERVSLKDLQRQTRESWKINEDLKAELKKIQTKTLPNKTDKEEKAKVSLRKQILERQNMVKVARNICQALIFGSDVDWEHDEELSEMVLSFGQPINLLDN